jgi:hypothetical protein
MNPAPSTHRTLARSHARTLARCTFLALALAAPLPAVLDNTVVQVTPGPAQNDHPALAFNGLNQWLLCNIVQTGFADTSGLYALRLFGSGPPGAQFQVTGNDLHFNRFPAVHHSPAGDFFLVVWTRPNDLRGQRVAGAAGGGTGGGELLGDPIDITTTGTALREQDPALAYNPEDAEFLCAFLAGDGFDNGKLYGLRLSGATGDPLGAPFLISADVPGQGKPDVDYSPAGDSYLVVWQEPGGAAVGRRIDRAGTPETAIFPLGISGPPAVAYADDRDEYLVAASFGPNIAFRRVLGTNPVSGSQFVTDVTPYAFSQGVNPDLVYVRSEQAWLMVFSGAPAPWPIRAAWIDATGPLNDLPLALNSGNHPVLPTHVDNVGTPRVAWDTTQIWSVLLPQQIPLGHSAGETYDIDLFRMPTIAALWNFVSLRPEGGLGGSLRLYSDFYTTAIADSSVSPGLPALIAIDREAGTVATPHVTVSLSSGLDPLPPRNRYALERRVAGLFDILTPPASREGVAADIDSAALQAFGLNCDASVEYAVTVLPRDPALHLGAAVFESSPSARYLGLSEALAHSPGSLSTPGAALDFSASEAGILGLAVYTAEGAGEYDLIFRPADACTGAEVVAYLLGLIPEPPGADVNGVPPIDAADVVAALLLGR